MLQMTRLKDSIWKTASAWLRQARLDKAAQPEALHPDKPDGPSPDKPETASQDQSAQSKTRLRDLLSKKIVTGTNIFAAAAITTLAGIVVFAIVGFVHRSVTPAPAAAPSGSQPASGAAAGPFAVDVTEDFGDCNAFALPSVLGEGPSYAQLTTSMSPSDAAWGTFLHSVSGAPVSHVGIALTFSGTGGSSVRITDIEIKQPKPPGPDYSGAFIPVPHEGGGDNSYNFTADLDRPNATLQAGPGQEDFPGFEINVSASLSSTVWIQFTGTDHSYSWFFVVDYDEGGHAKTMQVGAPGGGPFTLTGPSAAYGQVFVASAQGYTS